MSSVDLSAPVIAKYPASLKQPAIQFRPECGKIIAHLVEDGRSGLESRVLCDPHKIFDAVPQESRTSSKLSLEWLIKEKFPFVFQDRWIYFILPPGRVSTSEATLQSEYNIVPYISENERVRNSSRYSRKREQPTRVQSNRGSKYPRNNVTERKSESNSSESHDDFKTLFGDELRRLTQAEHNQDDIRLHAVLMRFEKALFQIRDEAEQRKLPPYSCFICFDFEESRVIKWVGTHIQDLELAGVTVFSSRKLTYGGAISVFQGKIFYADKVILVCTEGGQNKIRTRLEVDNWRGISAEMVMLLNSLELNRRTGNSVIPIYEEGVSREKSCLFPLFSGSKGIKDFIGRDVKDHVRYCREEALNAEYPDIVFDVCERNDLIIGTPAYYSEAVKLYGMIRGLDDTCVNRIQHEFISNSRNLLKKKITDFAPKERDSINEWRGEKESRSQDQLKKFLCGVEHPEALLAEHLKTFYSKQRFIARQEQELQWGFEVVVEGVEVDLSKKQKNKFQGNSSNAGSLLEEKTSSFELNADVVNHSSSLARGIRLADLFHHSEEEKSKTWILGVAGTGKTTLCREAVLPESSLWKKFDLIFLIKLRNLNRYVGERDIYKILACESGFELSEYGDLLVDQAVKKKILLILDGYDELPQHSQDIFTKFEQAFPHLLITSRPGFYKLEDTFTYDIIGFNDDSVKSYVEEFFHSSQKPLERNGGVSQTPSSSSSLQDDVDVGWIDTSEKDKIYRILNFLRDKPDLMKLARIPINLNLICHLFEEIKTHLTAERFISSTTLYIEMTNCLFRRCLVRLSELKGGGESVSTFQELLNPGYHKKIIPLTKTLERLAFRGMVEDRVVFNQKEIERYLGEDGGAYEYLKSIGMLRFSRTAPGKSEVEFVHLSFQEFFAANYLARFYLQRGSKKERRKALEKVKKKIVKIKFNQRFRGSLSMVAGILSYQENFIALQNFFDHVSDSPHDLGIIQELGLLASCFRQCSAVSLLSQFEYFIDQCLSLWRFSGSDSRIIRELLWDFSPFINHPKVISQLINDLKSATIGEKDIGLILFRQEGNLSDEFWDKLEGIIRELDNEQSAILPSLLLESLHYREIISRLSNFIGEKIKFCKENPHKRFKMDADEQKITDDDVFKWEVADAIMDAFVKSGHMNQQMFRWMMDYFEARLDPTNTRQFMGSYYSLESHREIAPSLSEIESKLESFAGENANVEKILLKKFPDQFERLRLNHSFAEKAGFPIHKLIEEVIDERELAQAIEACLEFPQKAFRNSDEWFEISFFNSLCKMMITRLSRGGRNNLDLRRQYIKLIRSLAEKQKDFKTGAFKILKNLSSDDLLPREIGSLVEFCLNSINSASQPSGGFFFFSKNSDLNPVDLELLFHLLKINEDDKVVNHLESIHSHVNQKSAKLLLEFIFSLKSPVTSQYCLENFIYPRIKENKDFIEEVVKFLDEFCKKETLSLNLIKSLSELTIELMRLHISRNEIQINLNTLCNLVKVLDFISRPSFLSEVIEIMREKIGKDSSITSKAIELLKTKKRCLNLVTEMRDVVLNFDWIDEFIFDNNFFKFLKISAIDLVMQDESVELSEKLSFAEEILTGINKWKPLLGPIFHNKNNSLASTHHELVSTLSKRLVELRELNSGHEQINSLLLNSLLYFKIIIDNIDNKEWQEQYLYILFHLKNNRGLLLIQKELFLNAFDWCDCKTYFNLFLAFKVCKIQNDFTAIDHYFSKLCNKIKTDFIDLNLFFVEEFVETNEIRIINSFLCFMKDEVLKYGNQLQKDQARRFLSDCSKSILDTFREHEDFINSFNFNAEDFRNSHLIKFANIFLRYREIFCNELDSDSLISIFNFYYYIYKGKFLSRFDVVNYLNNILYEVIDNRLETIDKDWLTSTLNLYVDFLCHKIPSNHNLDVVSLIDDKMLPIISSLSLSSHFQSCIDWLGDWNIDSDTCLKLFKHMMKVIRCEPILVLRLVDFLHSIRFHEKSYIQTGQYILLELARLSIDIYIKDNVDQTCIDEIISILDVFNMPYDGKNFNFSCMHFRFYDLLTSKELIDLASISNRGFNFVKKASFYSRRAFILSVPDRVLKIGDRRAWATIELPAHISLDTRSFLTLQEDSELGVLPVVESSSA